MPLKSNILSTVAGIVLLLIFITSTQSETPELLILADLLCNHLYTEGLGTFGVMDGALFSENVIYYLNVTYITMKERCEKNTSTNRWIPDELAITAQSLIQGLFGPETLLFLQKGIRVKKRHHIFINEAIFGCDCLSIVNLTAVKYFARILFMLYGPPMKFCTRVDEFEQKNVYAIEEQCFYTEDGKVGAENGWTKLEESEKLGNKS